MSATGVARSQHRLQGRIALVTGASRGLGAAAAVAYAREGAHCVLVARTVGGLEEVDDRIKALGNGRGGSATLVPLDLTDGPGIDRLGGALHERFGRLDVLLGNAGLLGTLSPLGHIDPDVFERTMAVNVTANWRLIRAMDPLLQKSDAGRAIFVTSGASRRARAYWGVYATSKAALDKLVEVYAAECAHTNVRVNLYNPGPTRTGMRQQAFPGEDPNTLAPPEAHAEGLIGLALPSCTLNGEWVAGDEALKEARQAS
jgi:NAD(P)-dependent dehydrogenase (short-subunit alcohol dehydrogenase family)